MSMIISVSYQSKEELETVLRLLDPIIKDWNRASKKKGQYNRVYIKTNVKEGQAYVK